MSNQSTGIIGIPDSSPNHWNFPHKNVQNASLLDQTVGKGFHEFFKDKVVVDRIGPKTRKHYESEPTPERQWKPSIRTSPTLVEPRKLDKLSCVRIVEKAERKEARPTGKARIVRSERSETNPIVGGSGIKIVKDSAMSNVAGRLGTEASQESLLQKKKRVDDSSNGLSLGYPGNKPYRESIHASGFYLKPTPPKSALEVSAFDPRTTDVDRKLIEQQRTRRKQQEQEKDITLVKQLDEWMPPAIKEQLERDKAAEQKRLEELRNNNKKKPTGKTTSKQQARNKK